MDPKEEEILRNFVRKRVLLGTFFMDVGFSYHDFSGIVDAIFVEALEPEVEPRILPSKWWRILFDEIKTKRRKITPIEVKRELNYEAIGQAIVYRHLFPKVWNLPIASPAIVCRETKRALKQVCQENGILVFEA